MDCAPSQFSSFEAVGNMDLGLDSSFIESELSLLNVYPNVQFGIFGLKDNCDTQIHSVPFHLVYVNRRNNDLIG
jgi:hypothetical protein